MPREFLFCLFLMSFGLLGAQDLSVADLRFEQQENTLGVDGQPLSVGAGVAELVETEGGTLLRLGSGTYRILLRRSDFR